MQDQLAEAIAQQRAAEPPKAVFPPLTAYRRGAMGDRSVNATVMRTNWYFQRDLNIAQLTNAQQAQNGGQAMGQVLQLIRGESNDVIN